MTNINQSFSVVQEVSQALMNMHNPSCESTNVLKIRSCCLQVFRRKPKIFGKFTRKNLLRRTFSVNFQPKSSENLLAGVLSFDFSQNFQNSFFQDASGKCFKSARTISFGITKIRALLSNLVILATLLKVYLVHCHKVETTLPRTANCIY